MNNLKTIIGLILLHTSSQECIRGPENPFGSCECKGQIFYGKDCRLAFMCDSISVDDGNDGCLIECAINEAAEHDWVTDDWVCIPRQEVSEEGCPGDFQNDCDANPEDFDPQCACAEEMWMNADCTEAYLCQNKESIVCGPGQIVEVLILNGELNEEVKCVDEKEAIPCPGAYHLGCKESLDDFGCPVEDYIGNPLGECLCEGQIFNDEDCGIGFFCTDVANNLGCLKTCDPGYTLLPFYVHDAWECYQSMTEDEGPDCLGAYELSCPDNAVQAEANECECPSQLLISHDCNSGYYCESEINGGGLTECGDGEEIAINLPGWGLFCREDNGNCPSLGGGFKVGCTSTENGETTDAAHNVCLNSVTIMGIMAIYIQV